MWSGSFLPLRRAVPGAVALAVLLPAGLASCTGPTPPPGAAATSPAGSYRPAPDDVAAIQELLDTRARAVLAGDRDAFLAGVDDESFAHVRAQETLFDNLAGIGVDEVSWTVDDTVLDADEVDDLGADDVVVRLRTVERVGLGPTTRAPVGQQVRMTYVRRDGTWLLGAESDHSRESVAAEPQPRPWFGDPVVAARDGRTLVVLDEHRGNAGRVAAVTARSLERVADVLGVPADDRLLVTLSDNTQEQMAALWPPPADDPTARTGVLGGRVLLADADERGAAGRYAGSAVQLAPDAVIGAYVPVPVLRHELAHHLLPPRLETVPVWLDEGLAAWAAAGPGATVRRPGGALARRMQQGGPLLPGDGDLGVDPERTYLVGAAAVEELVARRGIERVLTLRATFSRGVPKGWDSVRATDPVLRAVYGTTGDALARDVWRRLGLDPGLSGG